MILAMTCTLVACHMRDGDEGSIRVKPTQVIGIYEAKFDKGGFERLELKRDGTYLQDFTSKSRSFHHTGQWHLENDFLDGSEEILANALCPRKMRRIRRDLPNYAFLRMTIQER